MLTKIRHARAPWRLAVVNSLALMFLLAAAPEAAADGRANAKALHKEAKALRNKGDLDGALLKYVEAHDQFANLKVAQWIVSRHLEMGRKIEAAEFLQKMISEKKPSNGVAWAAEQLKPLQAEVDAAKAEAAAAAAAAAEEAKKKAAAEAKAKAEADAAAKAAAAAAAKAAAAQQAAELERLKSSSEEAARAKIQAEYDARDAARADAEFLPKQLIMWGAGVGVLGIVGYSVLGVNAADKRTEASACYAEFLESIRDGRDTQCSGQEYEDFDAEARDLDGFSNIALAVGAVGLTTAVVGGVLLWRAGMDDGAAADGEAGSAGDLMFAPGPGGASVIGTF